MILGNEDKIILDKQTIKALGVDTRLKILKLLDEQRKTLSELAEIMHLQPSSVKEHLDALVDAGLIAKEKTQRKWKYYSLTLKGRKIVHPTTTKVMFALFVGGVLGALWFGYHIIVHSINSLSTSLHGEMLVEEQARSAALAKTAVVTTTTLSSYSSFSWSWVMLFILALLSLLVSLWWLVLKTQTRR